MLQDIPPGETLSKLHERMVAVTRSQGRMMLYHGLPMPGIYYEEVFDAFVSGLFTTVNQN